MTRMYKKVYREIKEKIWLVISILIALQKRCAPCSRSYDTISRLGEAKKKKKRMGVKPRWKGKAKRYRATKSSKKLLLGTVTNAKTDENFRSSTLKSGKAYTAPLLCTCCMYTPPPKRSQHQHGQPTHVASYKGY